MKSMHWHLTKCLESQLLFPNLQLRKKHYISLRLNNRWKCVEEAHLWPINPMCWNLNDNMRRFNGRCFHGVIVHRKVLLLFNDHKSGWAHVRCWVFNGPSPFILCTIIKLHPQRCCMLLNHDSQTIYDLTGVFIRSLHTVWLVWVFIGVGAFGKKPYFHKRLVQLIQQCLITLLYICWKEIRICFPLPLI